MVVDAKLGEFSGICKSGSVIFCGDSGNCGFRVGADWDVGIPGWRYELRFGKAIRYMCVMTEVRN
mgnify:CR=1 FL=1